MAESMATGWYYLSNAGDGRQIGPLTWEQLLAGCVAGSLRPGDMLWHPTMPQWLPASQIQGLFPATAAAGTYPTAARSGSRALAWLIPLITLIIVGGSIGAYFGFFYNKDDKGGASIELESLYGTWEGTLDYTSLEIKSDMSDEDKELRDRVLNSEVPITIELSKGGTDAGVARMTTDMTAIDPSTGETSEDMTFTYSDGEITFDSDGADGTISAAVKERGDGLEMNGNMAFDDDTMSSKATWTVTKNK